MPFGESQCYPPCAGRLVVLTALSALQHHGVTVAVAPSPVRFARTWGARRGRACPSTWLGRHRVGRGAHCPRRWVRPDAAGVASDSLSTAVQYRWYLDEFLAARVMGHRNQPDNFDPMLLHEPNVGVALIGRRHPFRDNTIGTGDIALCAGTACAFRQRFRPGTIWIRQSLQVRWQRFPEPSMATRLRGQRRQDSQPPSAWSPRPNQAR